MKTIDVLIHVNETIEEAARFRLEEPLRDAEGMVTPRFSPQHHHLKFVAYDSDYTSVAAVLGQIAGVARILANDRNVRLNSHSRQAMVLQDEGCDRLLLGQSGRP